MRPRAGRCGLVTQRERCGKTATGVDGGEGVHGDERERVGMEEGVSVSVITRETEPTVDMMRESEREREKRGRRDGSSQL